MPVASRQQVLLEILFTLEKAANWCHSVGGRLSLEKRGLDKQKGVGEKGVKSLPGSPQHSGLLCRQKGERACFSETSGEGSGFTPALRDGLLIDRV